MKNSNSVLGEIYNNLNIAEALPELKPIDKGRSYVIECPNCEQSEAYIYKQGFHISCNRGVKCGYSKGLLDYISERDSISINEVIRKLAKLTNTSLPDYSEISDEEKQEFAKNRSKQNINNDILSLAKLGILVQNSPIRAYLEGRGYTSDEIINMDFGALPNKTGLKKELIKKGHSGELIDEVLSGLYETHPLLIPTYNPYGIIEGFLSRAINPAVEKKYNFTKGLERGNYFFNINEFKNNETLIIVEGEIDALLLTQKGVEGAVACGKDTPTDKQLENALKNKKVKNIILCLDNDPAGIKGTEKAIDKLKNKKINVFVATITDSSKDPDEFIKANGIEEFKKVLDNAESWDNWTIKQIVAKHNKETDIGKKDILDELLELESSITDKYDPTKRLISDNIVETIVKELGFSREILASIILSYDEKRAKEKQAEALEELLNEAKRLLKDGNLEEAKRVVDEDIIKIKSIVVSNIITPYPLDKAVEDIQKRPLGLKTGYSSLDKYITIPNGAITLVAGRPSHGKTTFLLNLMLNMVKDNPEKSFYFYSYEESKTALFTKLITILSEVVLSKNEKYKNSQNIESYIKGEQTYEPNINKALETYKNYVKAGRLWLVDNPLPVDVLAGTIANSKYSNDVGGVFIDYAQRVKYNGKYESERIKVSGVSTALKETAIDLKLPIIVGAQLNRTAIGKPQLDQLKETGNLEEDANTVLGIYNWRTAKFTEMIEEGSSKEKSNTLKNCKEKTVSTDVEKIDFEVHIMKNRDGVVNKNALLTYDAPKLKIKEYVGEIEREAEDTF